MVEQLAGGLLKAGLVDLDGTFFFQLVLFLVFFAALNALVVKPMIRAHTLRYQRMEGARHDAEAMDRRAADSLERYEGQMTDARREALALRDDLKSKADAERRRIVEAARHDAGAREAAARSEREATVARARPDVEAHASALADAIVERLLADRGREP